TVLLSEQGKGPDAAEVSWPEIGAPDPAESAQIRAQIVSSDTALINAQVLSPEQVAKARFMTPDGFEHEIQITEEELVEQANKRAEQDLEQAQADAQDVLNRSGTREDAWEESKHPRAEDGKFGEGSRDADSDSDEPKTSKTKEERIASRSK